MTKQRLQAIASVLILASLVLIAVGVSGPAVLWWVGLATLAAAMILSFATHWARSADEE